LEPLNSNWVVAVAAAAVFVGIKVVSSLHFEVVHLGVDFEIVVEVVEAAAAY
jgi:hypothetical protein